MVANLAPAVSHGRRLTGRLVTGAQRSFFTSQSCEVVYVPYPLVGAPQSLRGVTCGLALQASSSKEAVAALPLHELRAAERAALTLVEGEVAMAWALEHWPGLEQ